MIDILSIDEAIETLKYDIEIDMYIHDIAPQLAEWLEELKAIKSDEFTDDLLDMGFTKGYSKALEELKVIKEMDLSIPQHFTKEQSDWIKKYCINRNKEFYNKAIDDFLTEICKMIVQSENNGNYRFYAVEIKQSIADLAEQLKAGVENERY